MLKARKLLPFVDMAYQGFGAGLDDDAFAVRELARQNVPALVAELVLEELLAVRRALRRPERDLPERRRSQPRARAS